MYRVSRIHKHLIDRLVDVPAATLLGWWIGIVLVCAVSYQALSLWAPEHAPATFDGISLDHFLNSLYFSVVTVTTVGYGDFIPHGFSRAIAATEGVAGFALFGLLVAKISSRRQEQVMREVHRQVLADSVAGLREGLVVVRRDLDTLISDLKKGRVSDDGWETLDVAVLHANLLLNEIPALSAGRFGGIDPARDALLAEAVQRTVRRIGAFVDAAARAPAERYRNDLSSLLKTVADISRARKAAAWKTIATEADVIRARLSTGRPNASRRSKARSQPSPRSA